MSTLSNISTYQSTDEFYIGDLFNIAHDGTAITLGSEPQFSLDTRTINGAWMFSVIFKTAAITDQCIYSVDDGAGGRFLDICLLYTSPSPRDRQKSRMPSSA